MARMQADLETIRLAELYATHPLLRTMPVPHVRLPDVDLDIPVLIKTSEEPRVGESARGGVALADMKGKFNELLMAHLSRAAVALSPRDRKTLNAALDERFARIAIPTEISVDVNRVADDLTVMAFRVIGELIPKPAASEAVTHLTATADFAETVRNEFLKLRAAPPRLMVQVTSAEIREAGTAENVTRIRLKVSEQGVEWAKIESGGVQYDRLVPE